MPSTILSSSPCHARMPGNTAFSCLRYPYSCSGRLTDAWSTLELPATTVHFTMAIRVLN
ncbi:hypothetical protein F5146DRAFT_560546 [Armillaria mellea]|nr:hypothetical protein F5146DRAFT_560546 [Armillaria mellea]